MAKTWFKKHVFSGSGWLQIPTHVIWIILALVCIPVSNVHIHIEAEDSSCPLVCECGNVTPTSASDMSSQLQCGEQNLTQLSSDMFVTTTVFLNVSHNLLSALEFGNNVSTLPSFRTLLLSHNELRNISANAFQSFPNLQLLDLSWNLITSLSPSSFTDMTSLQHLSLSHNKLGQMSPELFAPLQSLQVLDISFNEVTSIENETFHSLKNLIGLNLAHNSLRKLNKTWFQKLFQLKVLNISMTSLTDVQYSEFTALVALQDLDLSKNNLTKISKEIFQHKLHLKHVNVSGNPFICDCDINHMILWLNMTHGADKMFSKELMCFSQGDHKWISVLKVSVNLLKCDTENVGEFAADPVIATVDSLPYNAMMGWYTAATLSGMLVLFFICIALDKVKREFFKKRREWRKKKKRYSQTSAGEMELQHTKPKLKRCARAHANENSSLSGSFNRKPNEECASSCHLHCEHTPSLVLKNDHELEHSFNGASFAFKKLNMASNIEKEENSSDHREIKHNFKRKTSQNKKIKRPHSDPYILYQTIGQTDEVNT